MPGETRVVPPLSRRRDFRSRPCPTCHRNQKHSRICLRIQPPVQVVAPRLAGPSLTSRVHTAPAIAQLLITPLVAAPHLTNLRLESLQAPRRYADPLLSVQPKAQKLAFPNPPRSALGGIHLQAQMLLDPLLYPSQRPLRRLTAHVDIAVIRVRAIAMLPPLQFLIQPIQIDIGHRRRQRSALRRPSTHHPVLRFLRILLCGSHRVLCAAPGRNP